MKFDFKFTIIAVIVMIVCLVGLYVVTNDSAPSSSSQQNAPAPANQADPAFTL